MTISNDRLATWAGRSLDVLLLLLILASLLTVLLARVVPLTGRSTFVVAGGSMVPTISLGSAVVVEPVAATDLRVGDVVSLRSGDKGAIFTHRIVRIAAGDDGVWIETKGDANASADPSLTPASGVIGRVALAFPVAGYAIALLSTLSGVIFVISLGLILFLAGEVVRSRTPVTRDARPRDEPIEVIDFA